MNFCLGAGLYDGTFAVRTQIIQHLDRLSDAQSRGFSLLNADSNRHFTG